MRKIKYFLLLFMSIVFILSSCKESEEQKRIKKAAKEKLLTATVIDSIITYDSLTRLYDTIVEHRTLKNIYRTPEKPANILRKDGTPASQYETTRKVSFFLSKNVKLPEFLQGPSKVEKAILGRFYISKEGRMMGIKILNPTYTALDTATLEVLYKLKHTYKWAPATHKGTPVNSQIIIPMRY